VKWFLLDLIGLGLRTAHDKILVNLPGPKIQGIWIVFFKSISFKEIVKNVFLPSQLIRIRSGNPFGLKNRTCRKKNDKKDIAHGVAYRLGGPKT
jgi:hypothetical protein